MAVAVPPSVGPLPMQQPFFERMRTLVGDAEGHERLKGVALLRRAPAVAASHERNPATAVGLGLGAGGELTEIARIEPELEDAVTEGMKAFVAFGISEVGEARQDPVKALPLVVNLPPSACPSELVAPRKKRADGGRAADLLAQCTNGLR